MSAPDKFDPHAYKATTREQWDRAADAWHRWGTSLEAWLGRATDLMLDLARVEPGSRVLDVAAGAGGQTIAAARRVGPSGFVLATDISSEILGFAKRSALDLGLDNVETLVADGESLKLEPTFDAAISRVGLIYFPDQVKALRGIRNCLRSGGRFATITYSTPKRNEFFSVPISIVRLRANLPPPAPGQPGPFSLGDEGALEGVLQKAGFSEIEVIKLDSPLVMQSAAEYTRFARESFGALHQMMTGLSEAQREQVWAEIEVEMRRFQGSLGFVGPCELLIGAGMNP
jgi:ubiquinone/menaquinone biosynthesis C-methylase UbiE